MAADKIRLARRQFLKAGAALGASALLPGMHGGCTIPCYCQGVVEPPQFYVQHCTPALGNLTGGRKPNILLVITDQEQADCFLPSTLNRPRLSQWRQSAVHFTHTFCSSPLCSPSRSSIFTGTFPHQNGMKGNMIYGSRGRPLDPQLPHLGSVLKSAGYRIGYKGKWDLSKGLGHEDYNVNDRGCASDYGFEGHYGTRTHQEIGLEGDGEAVRQAASWIGQQRKDHPWFLVVGLVNPHDIQHLYLNPFPNYIRPDVQLPASLYDDLVGKPIDQLRNPDLAHFRANMGESGWLKIISYYYHLIEQTDTHLETLHQALQHNGFLDDTIILYTSDHGEMAGAHGFPFKGWGYEEDLRVPLYVIHPGLEARTSDSLVSGVDLAPTIASLAGIQGWPAEIPGRDFSPILRGLAHEGRDSIFAEFIDGEYIPGVVDRPGWCVRIVRNRDWKYTFSADLYDGQLYNLNEDPHEMNNLFHDPAHLAQRQALHMRLQQWRSQTGDLLPCA